jgi:hypothetical protein
MIETGGERGRGKRPGECEGRRVVGGGLEQGGSETGKFVRPYERS